MPDIGRFTTIDPMADFVNYQSPYVLSDNNPVLYMDEAGLGIFRVFGNLFSRIGNGIASIFAGDSCSCKNYDSESFADSWNTMDFPKINDWLVNVFNGGGNKNKGGGNEEPESVSRQPLSSIDANPAGIVSLPTRIDNIAINIQNHYISSPEPNNPPPKIGRQRITRSGITVNRAIEFSSNSSTLNLPHPEKAIRDILKTLTDYPQIQLLITTNVSISDEKKLSLNTEINYDGGRGKISGLLSARAMAIYKFLVRRGVNPKRFQLETEKLRLMVVPQGQLLN